MQVREGDGVLIGGFIVSGDKPKSVVMRGIGPSLARAGVEGVLRNPVLDLYDSTGTLRAENDDWTSLPADSVPEGLAPSDPLESFLLVTLRPGSYTVVLRDAEGGTGVGLFELFDLAATRSKVGNISTRGVVGTGDNAMIAGFIVGGDEPTKVLVRAIGPSLTAMDVTGALADPNLELHDAQGSLIFSNDNWRSDQLNQIKATSIPPTDDHESAIVATLDPGSYTAIVRGTGNTTGVALVEVYNLDAP